MKHYFIINPAAGNGKGIANLLDRICAVCKNKGVDFYVYHTAKPLDATEYIKSICENDTSPARFYACGGDGTLNEVANGAARFPFAEIGLIPVGTGNDFVKNFSSIESFFDIEKQIDATPVEIDAIKFGDAYCINMFNMGFDCDVVRNVERIKRKPYIPSKMAYGAGIIMSFVKKIGKTPKIFIDGEAYNSKEILLAAGGNGSFYGGGYKAAPKALLDDGLIDMCVVKKVSKMRFLSLVGKYKKGKHADCDFGCVTYKKCKKVDFYFDTDEDICIDGEIMKSHSLSFEIAKKKLRFAVPGGAKCLNIENKEYVLK